MPATYRIGDAVPLTYTVRDSSGQLTNAAVTLTVTRPDGTNAGISANQVSTGVYTGVFSPTLAGLWTYLFTASGAVTDTEDGLIYVEPAVTASWYVTVAELRLALEGRQSALDQGLLEAACRSASSAVNRWCNRRFWRDPLPRVRRFRPIDPCEVWLRADVSGTAGLMVETDPDGDGVFETVWTAGADYDPDPLDIDQAGEPYAFTKLVATGSKRFPMRTAPGRPGLRVTARWGWSEVPPDVRMAAQIVAGRLYRRKDTPFGSEGFADFGAMRIVRSDPDIQALLQPYQRLAIG